MSDTGERSKAEEELGKIEEYLDSNVSLGTGPVLDRIAEIVTDSQRLENAAFNAGRGRVKELVKELDAARAEVERLRAKL